MLVDVYIRLGPDVVRNPVVLCCIPQSTSLLPNYSFLVLVPWKEPFHYGTYLRGTVILPSVPFSQSNTHTLLQNKGKVQWIITHAIIHNN